MIASFWIPVKRPMQFVISDTVSFELYPIIAYDNYDGCTLSLFPKIALCGTTTSDTHRKVNKHQQRLFIFYMTTPHHSSPCRAMHPPGAPDLWDPCGTPADLRDDSKVIERAASRVEQWTSKLNIKLRIWTYTQQCNQRRKKRRLPSLSVCNPLALNELTLIWNRCGNWRSRYSGTFTTRGLSSNCAWEKWFHRWTLFIDAS